MNKIHYAFLLSIILSSLQFSEGYAIAYLWSGTAGTTESWSATSNWLPGGPPGSNDDAVFNSPSGSLHDVVMPATEEINRLVLNDGRYEFRRATGSGTPWLLEVNDNGFPTGVEVASGANQEVELSMRDGELAIADGWNIGEGDDSTATVLATNMEIDVNWPLNIGGGSNSQALLRTTGGSLTANRGVVIGAGGALEILGDAVATITSGGGGDVFFVDGELVVSGELTTDIVQLDGSGTMTISEDGVVEASSGVLLSSADASLLVAGSGGDIARLTATEVLAAISTVTIGNQGLIDVNEFTARTLNLQPGGRLEVPTIGFSAPLTLNWTGGTIMLSGDLRADNVASNLTPLGANVTVDSGRELIVSGLLEVGTQSHGSLLIANGTTTSGSARIGTAGLPTGPATVAVAGANGSWNVAGNLTAGGLPGFQSTLIAISGGADVSVGEAFIAPQSLQAQVSVDGANSAFVSTDSTYLGGNATTAGGQGTMTLTNGAHLGVGNSSVDQFKVWDNGSVTMNQASMNLRNLHVRGSIAPASGAFVTGHITVAGTTVIDGGSIELTALSSNLIAGGDVTIQNGGELFAYIHQTGSATSVVVTGNGSTWTTPNVIATVLGSTTLGVGRVRALSLGAGAAANLAAGVSYAAGATDGLTISGGTLNAPTFNAGTVGVSGRGAINARYSGSGPIAATGSLTIGNATNTSGFVTTGTISVGQHTLTLLDANAAELGSGTILGAGGTPGTLIADKGVAVGGGETVFGHGTIQTPNAAAARLVNEGSMSGSGTSQRLTLTGYVTGVGSFTNVEFTGTLAPANVGVNLEAGLVTGSNYKFTPSSTLLMTIGGASPGFGFDVIFSSGEFIADGTLTVNLVDSFAPTIGQSFDMLDFTTLSGTFDTINLPALNPGLAWDDSLLYTQGKLSVVGGFLEADFDEDGDVDSTDLSIWKNAYNLNQLGDADGDNDSDGADFMLWQRQFGSAPATTVAQPAAAAVPEPSAAALLLAAMVGVGWRRSRARLRA